MIKILCHKDNFKEKLKDVSSWKITEVNKKKVKEFFKAYEIGTITGRLCANNSLLRYLYFLKIGLENLKKETQEGTKDFLERLLKDKITYTNGKKTNYPLRSKREILQILVRFLEWKYPKKIYITKPLKIKIITKKSEVETLEENEVKKLFKEADTKARKYLIAVLNSSGVRAEEFFNIRLADIKVPEGDEEFVKLTIRNQFSKTQGRTISLYEKNVLKAVKDFLNVRIAEGIKPDEPIFKITYSTAKKWLKLHGEKVLGKNVYFHLFRSTSATRLSSKMNRQQLCIYFGWSFTSNTPDKYIKRSGVNMQDVEDHFSNTRTEELKEEMDKFKSSIAGYFKATAKRNAELNILMDMYLSKIVSKKEREEALIKLRKYFTPESVYNIK